jgi:hypothetical protein
VILLMVGFSSVLMRQDLHVAQLQIVLIYYGMKLTDTLCLSHLICDSDQCLAGKASQLCYTFFLNILFKKIIERLFYSENLVNFVACCLHADSSS